jgi:hypothetical protein
MPVEALSDDDVSHLTTIVVRRLRYAPLSAPRLGETEPAYTARVIQPIVREEVERVGVKGILVAGDGGPPVQPVYFLGRIFIPDLTVSFHHHRAIACEVKLLRARQTQNALATAVGQASLYREAGYPESILCLIDTTGQFMAEAVLAATKGFESIGQLHLVVRRTVGVAMGPHPGSPPT